MNTFVPPRQARIIDSKYQKFSITLAQMGLVKQEFRAVGEAPDKSQVFVHPEDGSLSPNGELLAIRKDIVEFSEE